jgi:hypothetical protein
LKEKFLDNQASQSSSISSDRISFNQEWMKHKFFLRKRLMKN